MLDLLAGLDPHTEAPEGASPTPGNPSVLPDEDDGGFNWFSLQDEHVVVGEQRPVAVYRNTANGIVIRERGDDSPTDDMYIVLRDEAAAKALIAALTMEVGGRK
jgi:hypothetical protein